jgi:hypothetical protein
MVPVHRRQRLVLGVVAVLPEQLPGGDLEQE